ncbi:succinate dehydrogenase cytochrome b subunit [Marinifilum caeruleilacunae]|uniref:Succinate dehydrogenase cytochrome b subunit n=1 Tax=Marinifilum caeruleilacunae TaxID=2499076 RepID=A0ABX1X0Y6_9BACT|nr:succinate dehydrogenase cytochrome b subunit [Marinifilum caeruleilacunae]NOU62067.1 succinate dehydrogenase cytochrome b subunit [Marinifilum caeruleilacunae]
MSSFLSSSIGKKLIMSLSGLFLVLFLLVHLILNSFLMFDSTGELFNAGAHFMAMPVIRFGLQPVLFGGFIVHIIYAIILTLQNQKARPQKYASQNLGNSSTWSSRNMFVLGGLVLVFIVMHLMHFFVPMQITGEVPMKMVDGVEIHDGAALVKALFTTGTFGIVYTCIYVVGAILLGLHLAHGFWSSFQSIGMSNNIWRARLERAGYIYAIFIAGGFTIIPLYLHFFA